MSDTMPDAMTAQQFHHGFSALAHNAAMDIFYSDNPSDEEIESLFRANSCRVLALETAGRQNAPEYIRSALGSVPCLLSKWIRRASA